MYFCINKFFNMKNLELEIYLNKLKSFFEKNPNQLKELIGDVDPTIFYNHVRIVVEDNINTQNTLELTRSQMLEIILKINTKSSFKKIETSVNGFMSHHMGFICLN